MPVDWSIDDTHPDLFQLAHHLLVEPWDKSAMEHWNPTRKPGWRPGLAFSGGIDSAAAMALMPEDTVLLYNERTGISGQLDHTNAFRFFDKIRTDTGRIVHCIPSNHEELRRHQGKSAGFSTDYACAVQAILLADYFGLDSIGTGMPWRTHTFSTDTNIAISSNRGFGSTMRQCLTPSDFRCTSRLQVVQKWSISTL